MWLLEDLRYGLRAMSRHRAVTIAAVLSLALGVGANTTIFTLLNGVLLRPLPVQDSSELVAVQTIDQHNPGRLLNSYLNYKDYRDRNNVFTGLLLYAVVTVNLTGRGEPKSLMAHLASGNYFATLGVSPVIGRPFGAAEDSAPGANPVAVLSHSLWTREFSADPEITSRSIEINGRPFRIIGIAPEGFQGLNELYAGDVWIPMAMYPQIYPNPAWVEQRRFLGFAVAGRLKPGVSISQATAGMNVLAQQLEREYPRDNAGRKVELVPIAEAALEPKTRNVVTRTGTVLMIVSGLVLLIACGNVASLLLARAAGRTREITVRLALGANRRHLVRQLLAESVLLAILGGVAGLLMAAWARSLIWSVRPPPLRRAGMQFDIDWRVLAFNLSLSVLTGLVFGLTPAIRATRRDLVSDLKERTGAPAGRRRWTQSALIAGQVAFSLVALMGAGIFLDSLRNAGRVDAGFDATHIATAGFNLAEQGYNEARGREYQQRALDIAAGTPGVLSATLARDYSFQVQLARTVQIDGRDNGPSGGKITLTSVVWPGYFQTLGIPLLRGRDFSPLETPASPRVVIVNDVAASNFWPGEDPIGKVMHFAGDRNPAQVIAVARHANYRALGEEPQALIYLSLRQYYFPTAVVYARTAGDATALSATLARALQPLDRNLRLQSESVEDVIRESLWAQRLSAGLLTVFGAMALLMATVGIYAVVSYTVSQRVREIGLRMALGATGMTVQKMIVLEGLRLIAIGVAGGCIITLVIKRLVAGMLFGAAGASAATLLLIPCTLSMIAIAAWYVPARRATRIDPSMALRDE